MPHASLCLAITFGQPGLREFDSRYLPRDQWSSATIAEDYEQKHVGTMMAESEEVMFETTKENSAIWISKDGKFIKIMISAQGVGRPQTVQMTNEWDGTWDQ